MHRRSLLKGLGVLIVAPAIVKITNIMAVHSWIETLYSDGIRDDSPALNAILRGEPVHILGKGLYKNPGIIPENGIYAVSSPLELKGGNILRNSIYIALKPLETIIKTSEPSGNGIIEIIKNTFISCPDMRFSESIQWNGSTTNPYGRGKDDPETF